MSEIINPIPYQEALPDKTEDAALAAFVQVFSFFQQPAPWSKKTLLAIRSQPRTGGRKQEIKRGPGRHIRPIRKR